MDDGQGPNNRPWGGHRAIMLLALVIGTLLLGAPSTVAQDLPAQITVEATVLEEPGPLPPQDELYVDPLEVHVRCQSPSLMVAPVVIHHRIEVSHDRLSAAPETLQQTIATGLEECALTSTEVSYDLDVLYGLPRTFPAGEEVTFRLWTTIDGKEQLAAEWTREAAPSGTFLADAYPRSIASNPGEKSSIEILVVNRANTPLVVEIETLRPVPHGSLFFPQSLIVPYDPTSTKNAVTFNIEYGRTAVGTDTFQLQFSASAEGSGVPLGQQVITLQAEDDGASSAGIHESPAPAVVFMLSLLIYIAKILRKRLWRPGS